MVPETLSQHGRGVLPAVTLDGEVLAMRPSQTEQEVYLDIADGEMSLLWQLRRPDLGNAVEINTGAPSLCLAL